MTRVIFCCRARMGRDEHPCGNQSPGCLVFAAVLMVSMELPGLLHSADAPPVRGHILLPPTRGATVLSTYVDSQARYIAALGDHFESVAIARRHHAEAYDRELDNALKFVHTYFQRRELNHAYRFKEKRSYLDSLGDREKMQMELVIKYPEEIQKGDLSKKLNWLLQRNAGFLLAYAAVSGTEYRTGETAIGMQLDARDIQRIWLTEASVRYGQRIPFRAGDGKATQQPWPLVFLSPEFADARKAFEAAQDKARNELLGPQNQVSWETFRELQQAVDQLADVLARKYPPAVRSEMSGQDWAIFYDNGQRFLKAQAASVLRIAATQRPELFDGSMRFTGNSVFDLIEHMCRHGLEFAPAQSGDEGVYTRLLTALRYLYMEFHEDQS